MKYKSFCWMFNYVVEIIRKTLTLSKKKVYGACIQETKLLIVFLSYRDL